MYRILLDRPELRNTMHPLPVIPHIIKGKFAVVTHDPQTIEWMTQLVSASQYLEPPLFASTVEEITTVITECKVRLLLVDAALPDHGAEIVKSLWNIRYLSSYGFTRVEPASTDVLRSMMLAGVRNFFNNPTLSDLELAVWSCRIRIVIRE
jgi:hypothetical protein